MGAKYLLPCRCGKRIVVETFQAGENVSCSCGATLQVPRMLEIVALEPAPDMQAAATSAATDWGWPQQARLGGIVLLLAAIIGGGLIYRYRPVSAFATDTPEVLRENAAKLPPVATWMHWTQMKQGLDRRVDSQYMAAMSRYRLWFGAAAAAALLGVALLAAGTMLKPRPAIVLESNSSSA